jgi:hypothetical protein
MPCNPKLRGSPLTSIQLLIKEASDELMKQYTDIEETFQATKLKMKTLILHTMPSTSTINIEAVELEAQILITRLETLLSSHKSNIDILPASVLIDLYVTSGGTEEQVESSAQEVVTRFKKQYEIWEKRLHTVKRAFNTGRTESGGWFAYRKRSIKTFGEERVMGTKI